MEKKIYEFLKDIQKIIATCEKEMFDKTVKFSEYLDRKNKFDIAEIIDKCKDNKYTENFSVTRSSDLYIWNCGEGSIVTPKGIKFIEDYENNLAYN
ncbi:MAG: hypothetical protein ACRCSK_04025 [Fusobacteriaceae bacterium]